MTMLVEHKMLLKYVLVIILLMKFVGCETQSDFLKVISFDAEIITNLRTSVANLKEQFIKEFLFKKYILFI